ncbi:MAG: M20/M25/M40 family metallo-hydrolase [Candidatus Brocadiia bacterium]
MKDKIFAQISRNQNWSVNLLKEALSIPSISAQNKGLKESATLMIKIFRKHGFSVISETIKGNQVVLAGRDVDPKLPTILFYNHYDVQPPEPLEEWLSPPFKPVIRQGRIFARGAADNKGNLMARLAAVKAFDDAGIPLPVNVRFLVDGREEVGSPGLDEFIKKHHKDIRADICIWEFGYRTASGTPVLSLGCKGILYIELVARGSNRDLHSSKGIVVPNPGWQLVWALNSMKDQSERILIKGFYDKVNFRPASPSAFQGMKIYRIDSTPKQLGISRFVLGLKGDNLLKRYYYQPCLNINGLSGGYEGRGHKTVLPRQALVKADFRLVPDQDPADIIRKVRAHLNRRGFGNIEITSFHGYKPALTPPSHPRFRQLIGIMKAASKSVYAKPFEVEPISPASGPMYLFRGRLLNDMPCFALGIGHPGSNIHAPNENIYLNEYLKGTRFIAALMMELGRKF